MILLIASFPPVKVFFHYLSVHWFIMILPVIHNRLIQLFSNSYLTVPADNASLIAPRPGSTLFYLLRLANPAYGLAFTQNLSALFEHVGVEDIKG